MIWRRRRSTAADVVADQRAERWIVWRREQRYAPIATYRKGLQGAQVSVAVTILAVVARSTGTYPIAASHGVIFVVWNSGRHKRERAGHARWTARPARLSGLRLGGLRHDGRSQRRRQVVSASYVPRPTPPHPQYGSHDEMNHHHHI